MFIPIIPHTKITNKIVLYSDEILELDENKSNIKVSSISNIEENDLENCIKNIFEENNNVEFDTVQYSKKDKKVYFYADKLIKKTNWEKENLFQYKKINTYIDICEEIKTLLQSPPSMANDRISLYEIGKLILKEKQRFDTILETDINVGKETLRKDMGRSAYLHVSRFDYDTQILKMYYSIGSFGDDYYMRFKKINGDICLVNDKSNLYDDEVFLSISGIISKIYNLHIAYSHLFDDGEYDIIPTNSNFVIDLNQYGAKIKENDEIYERFSINFNSNGEGYRYSNCASEKIVEEIKGKEDELFKKIYIRIEKCPKWMRETLYATRQKEIDEIKKIEEEEKKQEYKKNKIKQLGRKFFPFVKNNNE